MAAKRKTIKMLVEVSVPKWMTAAHARREVRVSIGSDYSGFLECGPDYEEVDVKVRKVSPA